MTKKLITKSASMLDSVGFTQTTSAHDQQKAGGGITHTVFQHDETGERFYVRAKQEVYKGLAPFGRGMVEQAHENDVQLVIYFDDREAFYVFDPEYVLDEGTLEENYSKFDREDREWLEVSLEAGAPLIAYVRGEATPESTEQSRPSGLGEYI